jgi:gas vesicle protein
MDAQTQEPRHYGFVIGLLAGAVVGAGLTILLAPRVSAEIRERMTDSARRVGTRVDEAVDDLTQASQDARDRVADVAVRAAHIVEHYATVARS